MPSLIIRIRLPTVTPRYEIVFKKLFILDLKSPNLIVLCNIFCTYETKKIIVLLTFILKKYTKMSYTKLQKYFN